MHAVQSMARPRANQAKGNRAPFRLFRAALLGTLLSLGLVVLYAVALRQTWLATDTMGSMTVLIKVLGVAAAGLAARWGAGSRLWLWGALGGLCQSLTAFLLFSLLSGSFGFSVAVLSDFGLGAAAGLFAVLILQMFH